MKKLIALAFSTLLLGACSESGKSLTLETRLQNPLFAERYAETMVDLMVELEIQSDPLLEDESKKKIVDDTRRKWLKIGRDARKKQREGTAGHFIGTKEYTQGEALYVDNTLYLSTLFEAAPGPSLHLFLTAVVDPRDVEFPDETGIDLGRLESPYGAQQYNVPPVENPLLYRTVVLWDTKLERMYGFAQLGK